MRKILYVARREFLATVATRGFLVGVLMTPALIAFMILMMPRLMTDKSPTIEGQVAILDPSGKITSGVRDYLAPQAMAERYDEELRRAAEEAAKRVPGGIALGAGGGAAQQALQQALGKVPKLEVVEIPAGSNLENEKAPLRGDPKVEHRLALVVVHPDAVERRSGEADFGSYDLYVRGKLDDRIEREIQDALRSSIVGARTQAAGLDRAALEALTQVPRVGSVSVTATGESRTNEAINVLLPAGFMVLLLVSILTSSQYLMTTTVEEKSSRVVEVLLSAVSPLELMTGKILGQMAVGMTILVLYAGLGIATMVSFAVAGLIEWSLFLYLLVFYVMSYFVIASLMAAIGAAVNEMREAQTLLTPLMILIMIPWMLWMPITRNPNSAFSTAISFVPPINTFAMLLRMTSTTPPPTWQVWATIGVSALAVWGSLWFASKVFRVGLLMYGKPPNFATLVRWARMA